jgi:hypothetical protein
MSSGNPGHDEKRDYIRMAVDCRILYKDNAGKEHHGRAINLSGGGVLFMTDSPPALGSELSISVLPDTPVIQPLDVIAKVVRVDRVDGKFEVGVHITRHLK